jgi:hypothetical protein
MRTILNVKQHIVRCAKMLSHCHLCNRSFCSFGTAFPSDHAEAIEAIVTNVTLSKVRINHDHYCMFMQGAEKKKACSQRLTHHMLSDVFYCTSHEDAGAKDLFFFIIEAMDEGKGLPDIRFAHDCSKRSQRKKVKYIMP